MMATIAIVVRTTLAAAGLMALLLQPAAAQPPHSGHPMMGAASPSATAPSTQGFQAANATMHQAMMTADYTGDADVDFVRQMIPHHQGAIDMARVVLAQGKDPEIRKMASDIIKAQEREIAEMRAWLKKRGQ